MFIISREQGKSWFNEKLGEVCKVLNDNDRFVSFVASHDKEYPLLSTFSASQGDRGKYNKDIATPFQHEGLYILYGGHVRARWKKGDKKSPFSSKYTISIGEFDSPHMVQFNFSLQVYRSRAAESLIYVNMTSTFHEDWSVKGPVKRHLEYWVKDLYREYKKALKAFHRGLEVESKLFKQQQKSRSSALNRRFK